MRVLLVGRVPGLILSLTLRACEPRYEHELQQQKIPYYSTTAYRNELKVS